MSEGVEWVLHSCTVLAALPDEQALPAARLAEFHDVPAAYLAKHLQALPAAGIVGLRRPRGGYRLGPAPGRHHRARHRARRRRRRTPRSGAPRSASGARATARSPSYQRPCGIARAMWRAEDAWRAELARTTVADLLTELLGHRARRGPAGRRRVDPGGRDHEEEPSMKIFVTGATGVRRHPGRARPGGRRPRGHRRRPRRAKADLVRPPGRRPGDVDLFDPAAVEVAVKGHDAVAHLATHIPPMSKAGRAGAWEVNERLRRRRRRTTSVDAALATGAHALRAGVDRLPVPRPGRRLDRRGHPVDHDGVFEGAAHAEAAAARFAAGRHRRRPALRPVPRPGSHHVEAFNPLARRRINPFIGPPSYTSFIHAEDAGAAVAAALGARAGSTTSATTSPSPAATPGSPSPTPSAPSGPTLGPAPCRP